MGRRTRSRRQSGRFAGENTGSKGLLLTFGQHAGIDPAGRKAALLGAGGAAPAIAAELLLAGASIMVWNRGIERGQAMVARRSEMPSGNIGFTRREGTFVACSGANTLANATSMSRWQRTRAPDNRPC